MKYRLFIKLLINDYDKNKKYLNEKDIKKLYRVNKDISKLLEKIVKSQLKEAE